MASARFPALILGLLLSLGACGTVQLPPPGPSGTASYDAGLDAIAARETVLAFLTAYAHSGVGTEELAGLVTGAELKDWVRWLGVQNAGLEPPLTGELNLRGLRIVALADETAAASVDATVTFTVSADDETVTTDRTFASPLILVRPADAPRSWSVLDVSRDGRSMVDSIAVFDPPARRSRDRVRFEIISVYRFTSGTAVNLRLVNRGHRPLEIDLRGTFLQATGRLLQARSSTPGLAEALDPGATVEAALNFQAVPTTFVPELLILNLGDTTLTVELPVDAFLDDTGR